MKQEKEYKVFRTSQAVNDYILNKAKKNETIIFDEAGIINQGQASFSLLMSKKIAVMLDKFRPPHLRIVKRNK